MLKVIQAWDTWLFYAIHHVRNQFLDAVMPIFSMEWLPWVLGGGAFAAWGVHIARKKNARCHVRYMAFGVLMLLAASGLAEVAHKVVKYEVRRARPGHVLPDVRHLSREGWNYNPPDFKPVKLFGDSFFSGHAAHSTTLAVTAATLCPPLSPLIYTVPFFVGYSRIYLGRHYPLDVAGGWFAGAVIGLGFRRATRRMRQRLKPRDDDDCPLPEPPQKNRVDDQN